jgi:hypothetical protein
MLGTCSRHGIGIGIGTITSTGTGIRGGDGGSTATVPGVAVPDDDAVPEHGDGLLDRPERASGVDLGTVRCGCHARGPEQLATRIVASGQGSLIQDCKQHELSGGIYGSEPIE